MNLIKYFIGACVCLTSFQLTSGALFFPTNSAYGIFAAIAVPLDLPHRNVFISYNFEANYNLPATWDLPPIANGLEDEDILEQARHANSDTCTNCTASGAESEPPDGYTNSTTTTTESPLRNGTETEDGRRRRSLSQSLLSRTHFYHILKDKFERSGYEGEACLLRLICETNASGLGDINGILGTLIHIIFSPSTSMYEDLPLAYYQAEMDGAHEQCAYYAQDCKANLLDLISKPLEHIISTLMPKQ